MGFQLSLDGQTVSDREAYEKIDKRIFLRNPDEMPPGFKWPSAEEAAAARKQLRDIVTATIQRACAAEGATSDSIQLAISDVQIKQWWTPNPGEPGLPFVHMSAGPGRSTMAVAFAVYSGGYGIPHVSAHIQFYSKQDGAWRLTSELGEEFKDRIFAMAALNSPVEGEAWYLAWGMVIGDTGARLKVHLYAFNGDSVRTVWSREALRGGGVKVNGDGSVTLTYFIPPPEGKRIPPAEIHERLRPTVRGLEQ